MLEVVFNSGDVLRASDLQLCVDAIRELQEQADGGWQPGGDTGRDFPSDPLRRRFLAELGDRSTDGTKYQWKEKTKVGGTIADLGTPGTDGRHCTDSSHASAAVEAHGAKFIPPGTMVWLEEIADGADHRYVFIFLGPVLARVTAHTSGTATNFSPYTVKTLLGDVVITGVFNGFEDLQGSPGPLGVDVASDGSVGGSSCIIQPIGDGSDGTETHGAVVAIFWDIKNSRWMFFAPNSAQEPSSGSGSGSGT